ncbi:pyridoxal-phosphate dependent enzyme [Aquiflexum sp.]|uniref:pyridoxal-phosphate dependent enzyme n=1 Tax=Aquiflexum sp. TaxID=1872584 RepID=UPI0035932BC0
MYFRHYQGTSATIGRYIRYKCFYSKLLVVDPDNSVFYNFFQTADNQLTSKGSKIEGIGRPRVEPSFMPAVIDEMLQVPDKASIVTMLWLETVLGRKVGPSTGTNVWGVLQKAKLMKSVGKSGSIVTLLCDSGERYLDTFYNTQWIESNFGEIADYEEQLKKLVEAT